MEPEKPLEADSSVQVSKTTVRSTEDTLDVSKPVKKLAEKVKFSYCMLTSTLDLFFNLNFIPLVQKQDNIFNY